MASSIDHGLHTRTAIQRSVEDDFFFLREYAIFERQWKLNLLTHQHEILQVDNVDDVSELFKFDWNQSLRDRSDYP